MGRLSTKACTGLFFVGHVVQTKDRGAALISALLFLLILTVLGTTGIRTATLEEKMASNIQDSQLAFEAAEAALRDGESWIHDNAHLPGNQYAPPCPMDTICDFIEANTKVQGEFADMDLAWWDRNGSEFKARNTNDLGGVYQDPRYIIEKLDYIRQSASIGSVRMPPGVQMYRITGLGTGGNELARVVVRSTYAVPRP